MYRVKYTGNGQIEVNLPSYPSGIVIKHGDYARVNLSDSDKRVINSLKRLGLSFEEEKPESKKEEPKVEAPVVEEVPAEEKSVTKEDLMKNPAAELKKKLKELGVEEVEGKTKSELADMILEKVNG